MPHCPNCGTEVLIPLPVEPLYSATDAAQLVPMTRSLLIRYASTHKAELDPAHYRSWKRQRLRYFTAKDIRTIRAALYSTIRWPKAVKRIAAAMVELRSGPALAGPLAGAEPQRSEGDDA